MLTLEASGDKLPTCLILTQNIDNAVKVLAHVKLTPIMSDRESVFLESVVVHKLFRGQGIGRFLMNETELYCSKFLRLKKIYLSTMGQEVFYSRLGYDFCQPINVFGARPAKGNLVTKKSFMCKAINPQDTIVSNDKVDAKKSPAKTKKDEMEAMKESMSKLLLQMPAL
jgi:predicted N-acetyltransferase YhbS